MFEACPVHATGEYLTSKSTTNAQHSKEFVKPSPGPINTYYTTSGDGKYISILLSISNEYIEFQRLRFQFERLNL